MKRGEIWWADLPKPKSSAPGFKRPVLVVQNDHFTASRIQTITVLVITSNLRLEEAPGNVYLSSSHSKLPKDSVVNVSQILTIDKSVLSEKISTLNASLVAEVDKGLKLFLSL